MPLLYFARRCGHLLGWVVFLVTWGAAMAQPQSSFRCGTADPTPAQLAELRAISSLAPSRQPAGPVSYVPLRVHVVRRTDGSGGADEAAIYQGLAEVNALFVAANLQFYLCGAPHYIDNTAWYDFSSTDEAALTTPGPNYNDSQVNVYFPHSVTLSGVGGASYAYVNGGSGYRKVLMGFISGGALAHELGHLFGLPHTFNNNNSANVADRELVARTNCTTAGDQICDTPADPFDLPGATRNNCTYTGTARDAQGSLFVPSMTNGMSYWSCGTDYSPGQCSRMQACRQTTQASLSCSQAGAAPPTALTVSSGGCLGQTRLSWQNQPSTPASVGYFIERAGANGDFAAIGMADAAATSYLDNSAPSNVMTQYRVKPINAAAAFSNTVSLNTGRVYCAAAHSAISTCASPSGGAGLGSFTLRQGATTLLSYTAPGCGPVYSAFPSRYVRLLPGGTYTLALNLFSFNGGYYYPQHLSVWLDLNQDGTFAGPTEQLYQSSQASPNHSVTLTVPANVANACGALRIRTQYVSGGPITSACDLLGWGETQDYPVLFGTASATFGASARAATLLLLPNPAAGQVLLRLPAPPASPQDVCLLDRLGREVRRQRLPAHTREVSLSLTGLAAGLYVVRCGLAHQQLVVE
jgi:hypothetical protein